MEKSINRTSLLRTWAACAAGSLGFTAAAFAVRSCALFQAPAVQHIAAFLLRPGGLLWFRLGLAFSSGGFGNWLDSAFIVIGSAVAWSIPVFALIVGTNLLAGHDGRATPQPSRER